MTDAFDRLARRVRERAEQQEERATAARAERESWLARLEHEQRNVGERFSRDEEADRASREAALEAEFEKRRPQRSGPGCPSCGVVVNINGGCRCS